MKKFLKITGLLLLILIIAAIVLPFIFKDKIIARAKTEINRQIKGEVNFGEFDLTIFRSFPNFSFNINDVSLAGIEPFKGDTLFSARQLSLTLDLMSVINGDEYKVKEIILDQPRIHGIVLSDGTANWDIALPSEEEVTSSEPTSFNLKLDKLEINDGFIIYDDRQGNLYAMITDFDHTASGDFDENNYDLSTNTSMADLDLTMAGISYFKNTILNLKADLNMDMANSKYTFKENELRLNELILGFDGFVAMPGEAIDMDLKFNAKETEFKNILSLIPAVYLNDFNKVQTAGKLALNGAVKGRMEGEKMPAYNLNLKVSDAMFKYPDLPKSVNNIQVDLSADNPDGIDDHTVINIRRFHMEMAGNPFDARVLVKTPVSDPQIDAEMKGTIILSSLKDIIPAEPGEQMTGTITADIVAKGKMSSIEKEQYDQFNLAGTLGMKDFVYKSAEDPMDMKINEGKLNFSPAFVELPTFNAKMGKSDMSATGRIDNLLNYIFSDDLLTGTFNMKSGTFDLNAFSSGEDEPVSNEPAESTGVVEIPRNIDFKLSAAIGSLLYENLNLKNVLADIHVSEGTVDISRLKADLMGGSMGMKGKYSTTDPGSPLMDFDMEVANFDIQQTVTHFESVKQMAPIAKHAKGKFSTNFKIAGRLDEQMNPVYSSLNGGGKLMTSEVLLTNFEVAKKLASTLKISSLDPLNIQDLNPSFKFKDGRVFVEPVNVKIGNSIKGEIAGSNGFDQTLDYLWKLVIKTGSLGTQASSALNSLAGKAGLPGVANASELPVNVKVGGTTTDPKVEISMQQFATSVKEQITTQVENKVEEVKEDAKAKAREEADKILRDAQAQADRVKAEAKSAAAKVKQEGYAAAAKLEAEASNPIAKAAAKKAADKMRKETDAKAQTIENEGNKKADQIMQEARTRADKLLQ